MTSSVQTPLVAPPGLAKVVVADTAVGGVRGEEGFFHYGPYDATELARERSLEDVWHLLLRGELPIGAEIEAFAKFVNNARLLEPDVVTLCRAIAETTRFREPLGALRTAISGTAAVRGLEPWLGRPRSEVEAEVTDLVAAVPSLLVAMWNHSRGAKIPELTSSVAHDLLAGISGPDPVPEHVTALERYLVLTADHGFNASTFASRVVASTGADVGSALASGMGALSGPLHGGAPALVLEMLAEIRTGDNARSWVTDALGNGRRIMGFGHRVYRTEDPRSELLKQTALELGGPTAELAVHVEGVVLEELDRYRPDHPVRTNVEYYAGVVLNQIGLPSSLFTAAFAVSRAAGWGAHVLEQMENNRIIRPSSRYVGAEPERATSVSPGAPAG